MFVVESFHICLLLSLPLSKSFHIFLLSPPLQKKTKLIHARDAERVGRDRVKPSRPLLGSSLALPRRLDSGALVSRDIKSSRPLLPRSTTTKPDRPTNQSPERSPPPSLYHHEAPPPSLCRLLPSSRSAFVRKLGPPPSSLSPSSLLSSSLLPSPSRRPIVPVCSSGRGMECHGRVPPSRRRCRCRRRRICKKIKITG